MSTSALTDLGAQLDSEDAATVLAAVWDVLTLTAELADAITFEEGSDELQAMVVAQKCSQARDRLPLPARGEPVQATAPPPGAVGLEPYVHLLERARDSVVRLGTTADQVGEGAKGSLDEVASLAAGAAVALAAVRER
ncbi:hypothetical protein [Streptomyces sp. NPDC051211]|uniref:hypothetical protein n=1 Tax=Streptomyces sp. NPDC051211 TaxID=3154643 RepID=UPI00345073E8